jgi:16S rRNA (guanine1207-N2)-methyltransferase
VMEVSGDVLDLGCGAGALGVIAAKEGAHRVVMLDSDVEAVRSANETARRNNVQNTEAFVSDVTSALAGAQQFDVVITNPPFHSGKATDLALPNRFIGEAHNALRKGGRLYLVANRTLPYEREVQRVFGNIGTAHDSARFKVLTATRTS